MQKVKPVIDDIMIYGGFKKTIFVTRMTELIVLIFVSDFFHVPHIKSIRMNFLFKNILISTNNLSSFLKFCLQNCLNTFERLLRGT
jgi:hypothetical protein